MKLAGKRLSPKDVELPCRNRTLWVIFSAPRKQPGNLNEERKLMDWRVLITTFGVIFLAEMGDKTQLAAMTMAAQTKRPWAVFLGASLALIAVSGIGVLVGGAIGNYVPIFWVKRVAAVAFIVIGVLMLLGKF
jgi:putative Ca2+/H+ antiporter (TMEM165/GDT1 family)